LSRPSGSSSGRSPPTAAAWTIPRRASLPLTGEAPGSKLTACMAPAFPVNPRSHHMSWATLW
jgi:hypothetical protein